MVFYNRYIIKELKNTEDVLMIMQDLVNLKAYFDTNNKPKYLTTDEAKSEVKKSILVSKVRQFIER